MSRLFLFLAALPCLLAAPAVAEPLYLKCPADANPSTGGWLFVVDTEAATVEEKDEKGWTEVIVAQAFPEKMQAMFSAYKTSTLYSVDIFYDAADPHMTVKVDGNGPSLRRRRSRIDCVLAPPFTAADVEYDAWLAAQPPEVQAKKAEWDALFAEAERRAAGQRRPFPWAAVLIAGALCVAFVVAVVRFVRHIWAGLRRAVGGRAGRDGAA